ncbi:GIY-YIG nuclease family protein [Streptomyces sp. NPDC088348]|uniref:GIY-YIG nuclease family protein n=1 Tax=Streptomyces sp. NPDC088348 TaxID=3365853 RepID=UPI0037F32258
MISFPHRRPSEFVFVERAVLEDPRLSLAAKGLYAIVAAWEEGRNSPTDESAAAVLDELVAAGYAAVGEDGDVAVGWFEEAKEPEPTEPRLVPRPRADTQSAGFAYAIGDASAEQVKIGFTQNVGQRLRGLQTGHHAELHVLWQGTGGAAMEAHLHARFTRRRIRGEWFDFTGVDAQKLIAQAAKSFRGVAQ